MAPMDIWGPSNGHVVEIEQAMAHIVRALEIGVEGESANREYHLKECRAGLKMVLARIKRDRDKAMANDPMGRAHDYMVRAREAWQRSCDIEVDFIKNGSKPDQVHGLASCIIEADKARIDMEADMEAMRDEAAVAAIDGFLERIRDKHRAAVEGLN